MNAKPILTASLCLAVAAVCLAQSTHTGTWKLNESKSKFASGVVKNHTVVYEAAGDNTKVVVDGTDGQGNTVHSEWTGKFDGQDYPVTGDPLTDTRSYVTVDANTMTFANKKARKDNCHGARRYCRRRQESYCHDQGNKCEREELRERRRLR